MLAALGGADEGLRGADQLAEPGMGMTGRTVTAPAEAAARAAATGLRGAWVAWVAASGAAGVAPGSGVAAALPSRVSGAPSGRVAGNEGTPPSCAACTAGSVPARAG